jgi:hypothetical protein
MIVLAVVICIIGFLGAATLLGEYIHPVFGMILCLVVNIVVGISEGKIGVMIVGGIGIIMGMIFFATAKTSGGYYDPHDPYNADNRKLWHESRRNGRHRCGNCKKYSDINMKCRIDNSFRSPRNSCYHWT